MILEGKLIGAERLLASALRDLDHQLKEAAATLWGHERGPNYKERCAENARDLDEAHDEIAKCKKDLFQFKLKHGDSNA